MEPVIPIRSFIMAAMAWLVVVACPLHGQTVESARQTETARIHIQNGASPVLALEVNGERIKGDGRLRYVGSIGGSDESMHEIRWTCVCDPNPNGGASIEGRFDVDGPFDGWVMIEMPLNPVVDGPVALQLAGSLRGRSSEPGVVLTIARDDHALAYYVDDEVVDRYGRGPFTMQRQQAGATAPRAWSTGEKGDHTQPILVDRCRDRIAVRVSCRIDAGVEAVFTARMRLVGKQEDFAYRELEEDGVPSGGLIPRAGEEISIAVSGASRGRGGRSRSGARPNKPAAVVRPVPASSDSASRGSAVEE